jgi:hypothetical protein
MALTLVAHDGFTGVADTPIAGRTPDIVSAGGVWAEDGDDGSHKISSGGNRITNTALPRSYINDSLNADQAVAVTVHNNGSLFLLARFSLGATDLYTFSGYALEWAGTDFKLYECAGGGVSKSNWTQIGTFSPSFVAGDEMYIEDVGTGLVAKINGVTRITVTDASHAAGQVGILADFGGDGYADNYKTYHDTGIVRRWILGTH